MYQLVLIFDPSSVMSLRWLTSAGTPSERSARVMSSAFGRRSKMSFGTMIE